MHHLGWARTPLDPKVNGEPCNLECAYEFCRASDLAVQGWAGTLVTRYGGDGITPDRPFIRYTHQH
jgi:hypothetical protein